MNPERIILFVGGPFDGQRRKWGTNQLCQKILTMTFGEPFEGFYRIQVFRTEEIRHEIAVHHDVIDVMQNLLEGYHPKK